MRRASATMRRASSGSSIQVPKPSRGMRFPSTTIAGWSVMGGSGAWGGLPMRRRRGFKQPVGDLVPERLHSAAEGALVADAAGAVVGGAAEHGLLRRGRVGAQRAVRGGGGGDGIVGEQPRADRGAHLIEIVGPQAVVQLGKEVVAVVTPALPGLEDAARQVRSRPQAVAPD